MVSVAPSLYLTFTLLGWISLYPFRPLHGLQVAQLVNGVTVELLELSQFRGVSPCALLIFK
jgi:hypothetical protein